MVAGLMFQYHALEEPVRLGGDVLSLRCRKNGSFHGLDMGIFRGEERLCGGYALRVDEAALSPALAFAQHPGGLVWMHAPGSSLEVIQEALAVEGTPALMLRLTFRNHGATPATLDVRLKISTETEQSQDVVQGNGSAATAAGTLMWGAAEAKAVLSEEGAGELAVRLQLGAHGTGQALFYLGLAPEKKEATELLRYLRQHAVQLEENRERRLGLWRGICRLEAPCPALVEAWQEKGWRVEESLRPSPGGQRLPVEADGRTLVAPGRTPAYEALLAMGMFELFTQGMMTVRDASLAYAQSGSVMGKILLDGQVQEIGDSLSTAQYVSLAYEGMCWSGDESMLRSLFPFLKQNMDYLALVSGAFGTQPGAVPMPGPVRREVAKTCRAYARLLRALRLPGDAEYQTYAGRMAVPETPASGPVEQELALHLPELLGGSMEGLYAAVPALMQRLFGVRPRAHRREIVCASALPMGWQQWTLRDVRIGQEMFSFRCTRGEANATLTLYTNAKGWKAITPNGTQEITGETVIPVALG